MEKQAKHKSKILKLLPKAASAVTFQNLPFSPGRDKRPDLNASKLKAHAGRGLSGPIISIIPDEARRKSKNNEGFETQEPTSPKISCIGQIKHKKKIKKAAAKPRSSPPQDLKPVPSSFPFSSPRVVKKHASAIRRIFSGSKPARKSDASSENKPAIPDRAPSLGQMRRFASGRDAFAGFDWTAQIAPVEANHRNYYSDEETGEDHEEEDEEIMIPFSAPLMVGGGVPLQPRKEVNLWKRRTMNPPRPLRLQSMVSAN